MFRKMRLFAVVALLAVIGTSSGGLRDLFGLLFIAYLVFRAWPAVRQDMGFLWQTAASFRPGRRAGRSNSTL